MSGAAGEIPFSTKPVYRNAAAHQCSYAAAGPGRHVIGYQDEEYHVIGLYFGHGPDGRRTLCYVLRSINRTGEGLQVWERHIPVTGAQA